MPHRRWRPPLPAAFRQPVGEVAVELEHNCVTGVKKDEMIWTVAGEESAARADKPHRRLVVGGRDGGGWPIPEGRRRR
ncbi:hypothetical protein JT06_07985 [Desulfobulbus sp. Tol-SR]|nr:hypothetical protein JT06_07985 [Desulfobulbus sp. Tol-SR]